MHTDLRDRKPTNRTTPPPSLASIRHPVLRRLHEEWNVLARQPSALREVASWGLPIVIDSSLDELFLGYDTGNGLSSADNDPVFSAVARLASTSELAARIVLQRMLPGLCAASRRGVEGSSGRHGLLDELIGEAWNTIRTINPERCDRFVIYKLVRTCEHLVLRKPHRRVATVVALPREKLERPAPERHVEPLEELTELLLLARNAGGLQPGDLELVAAVLAAPNATSAAKQLRISARTLRTHRDQLAHRLRSLAVA
jgi:hypothetical protein